MAGGTSKSKPHVLNNHNPRCASAKSIFGGQNRQNTCTHSRVVPYLKIVLRGVPWFRADVQDYTPKPPCRMNSISCLGTSHVWTGKEQHTYAAASPFGTYQRFKLYAQSMHPREPTNSGYCRAVCCVQPLRLRCVFVNGTYFMAYCPCGQRSVYPTDAPPCISYFCTIIPQYTENPVQFLQRTGRYTTISRHPNRTQTEGEEWIMEKGCSNHAAPPYHAQRVPTTAHT